MTHLTSQEFVEALDGTLAPKAAGHLTHCDACRAEVDTLRALMTDVEGARDLPEPSPLFWAHFSERVNRATADLTPGRTPWWEHIWKPAVGLAAAAAATVLVVSLHRSADVSIANGAGVSAGTPAAAAQALPVDDDSIAFIANLASGLDPETRQAAARPSADATAAVISQMTPAQQAELMRLIRQQMGSN
jgi:hypothetical protein